MPVLNKRFVVDDEGKPVGVFLDIEDYRKLLEELEELDSIRAFDRAKASGEKSIPFDQAIAEIERDRK